MNAMGLLKASGASALSMKHEMTEMALVTPPPALHGAAVTVMDGPFFSLMPYPSRGLFDSTEKGSRAPAPVLFQNTTRIPHPSEYDWDGLSLAQ